MGFIELSGADFYGGALSGLSVCWPKFKVRARESDVCASESAKNMRNVIRLVGMFWLIENALQVGSVGGTGAVGNAADMA